MAHKITRNITQVKDIDKQGLNTNNQNDLLSDDKHVYVRNQKEYHCLTDNVKEVNGVKPDLEDGNKAGINIGIEIINEGIGNPKGLGVTYGNKFIIKTVNSKGTDLGVNGGSSYIVKLNTSNILNENGVSIDSLIKSITDRVTELEKTNESE